MAQRITAEEAAALIQDNMTLGVGGFGAYAAPDELLSALAERYERLGSPRALTAVCGISPGSNRPDGRGLARLRAPGLLDTVMAGHFANPPEIAELIGTNQVAAYALPLGVMLHLWRAIAGHKPAVLTHVGLGTFADPRVEGCKANQKTRAQGRDIVELVSLDGRDYLAYKTFPIDACFIRATWADEDGSLSMEDEGVGDYAAELAAATHNSGGIVIAQVRGIVSRGSLPPKSVRVHHPMVDYVVVKFPKWPFDKFHGASRKLGSQMKATGEVMSIEHTFEAALMKAVRGAEIKLDSLHYNDTTGRSLDERLASMDDLRLFTIFEALTQGVSVEHIHDITKIDEWFICKLKNLVDYEAKIKNTMTDALYLQGKKYGYLDKTLARWRGRECPPPPPAQL